MCLLQGEAAYRRTAPEPRRYFHEKFLRQPATIPGDTVYSGMTSFLHCVGGRLIYLRLPESDALSFVHY